MKKVTALLLLTIMALSAMRPVIAMHYCMGELHSFNLYQHHEIAAPCTLHSDTKEVAQASLSKEAIDTTTSCCTSNSNESEATVAYHQLTTPWHNCCDDTFLEISTDDFQANKSVSISRIIPTLIVDGLFHKTSLINQPIPETSDLPSGMEFPPGGLFLKDIDILSYICIYRI